MMSQRRITVHEPDADGRHAGAGDDAPGAEQGGSGGKNTGNGDGRAGRAPNYIPEDRILDAAYELLLAAGMRGLTMSDIARRAGVSRATVHRRWPNVRAVTAALMTREWTAQAAAAMGEEPTARERLTACVVRLAGTARGHPLLQKILSLDPEFLLPYLLRRRGATAGQQLALLEQGMREGHADGSVRPADPALQAQSVLLTAWSFVLSGPALAAPGDLERLDAELHGLLDRYLAP